MIPPLPSDIFHPGQVLNNTYEIEGVIGRGGTGEAYRARNQVSGRVVAVKALSRQFSGNDDYVELMRREEQMRDISHDAVVRYTECSRSDDGNVFLVMDYIEGPSLQDELRRRRLDPRELLIIGHRVAEGLEAAHRRGIVHRDLSPDNIVLRGGEPEKATLIDFGIAKDTTAGARTIVGNDFAGKYEYAAPEQLEGRADARSDLYALGASLLAVWRGEVPFAGATPGEMIRRKHQPLDTSNVPEPLKGVIDRLAAPDPSDRPGSAAEVLTLIEGALKLGKGRDGRRGGAPSGRRADRSLDLLAAAVALLIIALLGGLWWTGRLDALIAPEPPLADPFRLSASVAGEPSLSGHAPDEEAATLLRRAFGTASGEMPLESALTLARGVPSEGWAPGLAALIAAAEGLEDWTLEAEGLEVRLAGLVPDAAARDRLEGELAAKAEEAGLSLDLEIAAGPRLLPPEEVAAALAAVATCGRLLPADPPEEGWPLGATVRVRGDLADRADAERVRAALAPVVGDRTIEVEAEVLNADLCAVRALLPSLPSGGMSIRLADGATGEANLPGVFRVGDNPVVDVEVPASIEDGWLWVILVDNTGKVFNLIPNVADPEHRVAELGTVESGIRRIRVLFSEDEFRADNTHLAFRVSEDDFGKSEIIAILSRKPLFAIRRPRDESVESFAQGLAEALADDPGNPVAVAARILEARP